MFKKITAILALSVFLISAGLAMAQAPSRGDAPKVQYRKKTVYDFDDDLVEGELQRPDGEFIDTARRAKHSSLITIRENFIPEMLKSAEDI